MSDIQQQFSELVQDAQRDDGYINATKWAKVFGYDLRSWKRLPETKGRAKALKQLPEVDTPEIAQSKSESVKIAQSKSESVKIAQSEISPWIVERVGKTWVTWVHPIMAVHLASYLDPAFANYVAEVFVRYVTADPTLAADIASRQETTEGLDIINKAVQERYKFLEGRDWFYALPFSKVEMSFYSKRWHLPQKDFIPIRRYLDFSNYNVIPDFFKDKYLGIYRLIMEQGSNHDDQAFLLGYFKEEIDTWVRKKNTEDDTF